MDYYTPAVLGAAMGETPNFRPKNTKKWGKCLESAEAVEFRGKACYNKANER
ncbi:MAG: hypothetical protein ACI4PV_05060 [Butyricicoccus sp.]